MRVTGGRKRIFLDVVLLGVIGLAAWFAFLHRQQIKAPKGVETIPLTARWLWDPESPDIQDWQILRRPVSIIAGLPGELLVSDKSEARITRFTTDGELIEVIGRRGDGPGEFSRCCDLAFNSESSVLWVVDRGRGQGIISRFRLKPGGSELLDQFQVPQVRVERTPSLVVIDPHSFWIVDLMGWYTGQKRIHRVNDRGITTLQFGDFWLPEGWDTPGLANLDTGYLSAIGPDTLAYMWEHKPALELWSSEGSLLVEVEINVPEVESLEDWSDLINRRDDSGRNWLPPSYSGCLVWHREDGALYFSTFGIVRRGAVLFDVDIDIAIYAYSPELLRPVKRYRLPTSSIDNAVGVSGLVVRGAGDDIQFYALDGNRNAVVVLEPLKRSAQVPGSMSSLQPPL